MRPIDLTNKTKIELDNLLDNYRRKGLTKHPVFLEAMQRREALYGKTLDFDKTLEAIRQSARDGVCLSYDDVAVRTGGTVSKLHNQLSAHLLRLVEYARAKGWPMITAVVVNKKNVASGEMDSAALEGFMRAAVANDYLDEEVEPEALQAFVREQQEKTFEWARSQPE